MAGRVANRRFWVEFWCHFALFALRGARKLVDLPSDMLSFALYRSVRIIVTIALGGARVNGAAGAMALCAVL